MSLPPSSSEKENFLSPIALKSPLQTGRDVTKDEARDNLARRSIELILEDRRKGSFGGMPSEEIRETITIKPQILIPSVV